MIPMFLVLSWGEEHRGEGYGLDRAQTSAHGLEWGRRREPKQVGRLWSPGGRFSWSKWSDVA